MGEIQRNPTAPFLSDEAINALTCLFFKQDNIINKADLLFIFGTTRQAKNCANAAKNLLLKGVSDTVLITGGFPNFNDKNNKRGWGDSDAQQIFKNIDKNLFPNTQFLHECMSQNTLENVTNGLKVIDFSHFSRVAYITSKVHALRGYLTLKKFISPHTRLLRHTYATIGRSGKNIDQNNWHMSREGITYIWGEFERIRLYGGRGDILLDEIQNEVKYIQKLVN
jgi:hypothetical protein